MCAQTCCSRRWYAVNTHPNRECFAADQLENQNFQAFVPKQQKTVRHARKTVKRIASFFPGYLFVSLDLQTDRWRSVNGTFGVRSLVMQGERPLPTPHGMVENLRSLVDESGFVRPPQDLKPGDAIRITNGPFAETLGNIDRLDGKNRVRVLLQMLHGRIPVVIEREYIVKRFEQRQFDS
ncbi:transcription termination/antitermination protein NusG [Hoeflea sp. TYP-13]|uniref:transcription termination/antitermination protein NusG n=1 Tax=Hoeflea sp. TYP-13 TaxID=3230023 RepID=UPI0034C639AD